MRASSAANKARASVKKHGALIHLLGFVVVAGVGGDVAYLPVSQPSFYIGNQAFFSTRTQHVTEVECVHLIGTGDFCLDLTAQFDAKFVHEF